VVVNHLKIDINANNDKKIFNIHFICYLFMANKLYFFGKKLNQNADKHSKRAR
jgi:hypothetical protein